MANFSGRQQLKQIEDDILDVMLSLTATRDTIKGMARCWAPSDASCSACFTSLEEGVMALQTQAQSLKDKVQSTTQGVSTGMPGYHC
jgi:hypothetical protein